MVVLLLSGLLHAAASLVSHLSTQLEFHGKGSIYHTGSHQLVPLLSIIKYFVVVQVKMLHFQDWLLFKGLSIDITGMSKNCLHSCN